MAASQYTINTANGGATVYKNPDGTVTAVSGDNKWTGSQSDFNTAFGNAAAANPNQTATITGYDAGTKTGVGTTTGQKLDASQKVVSAGGDNAAVNSVLTADQGSSTDDAAAKAIAAAQAAQAKAEKTAKEVAAQAAQAATANKAAAAETAAATTATAVNAQMGNDASTGAATGASPTDPTAAYSEMLKGAMNGPTVEETKKVAADAEATAQKEADVKLTYLETVEANAKIADQQRKDLEAKRLGADAAKAQLDADNNQAELDLKQAQLDQEAKALRQQTEKDIIIQKDIAALSMHKLGLVGSGSSVATMTAIATNGLTKLADIESKYKTASLGIALEAKKSKDKLVYDLNKLIDDFTTKQIDNNENTAKRIAENQKNVLMTKLEKEKQQKELIKEATKERNDNQDRMLKFASIRSNLAQEEADRAEKKAEKVKAEAMTKASTMVKNGAWYSLTPEQQAKWEKDAGLEPGTIRKDTMMMVGKDVRKMIDDLGVKGYFPSSSAMKSINNRVIELMSTGDMDMANATNSAFGQFVAEDPGLKAAIAESKKKAAGSGDGKLDYEKITEIVDGKSVESYIEKKAYDNMTREFMAAGGNSNPDAVEKRRKMIEAMRMTADTKVTNPDAERPQTMYGEVGGVTGDYSVITDPSSGKFKVGIPMGTGKDSKPLMEWRDFTKKAQPSSGGSTPSFSSKKIPG